MTAILAEPFTQQEAAEFEQLIFASSNPDHKIRLLARTTLASFVNQHGKTKCDMMLAHLSTFHDAQRASLHVPGRFHYLPAGAAFKANGDRHADNARRYLADGKPEHAKGSLAKANKNYRAANEVNKLDKF